jgi:hypothetical protein
MAAKKAATKKSKTADAVVADKPWFPADAKPATAATEPAKKMSPWQRRAAPVNYGTLAKPGISMRQVFNLHIEEKHKKLSETQRDAVWKVVGSKLLSEPLNRLKEITDAEVKAHAGYK